MSASKGRLAGERHRVGIPGLPAGQESGHVLLSPRGHRGDSGIFSARASQGLDQAVPINFIVHNALPSIPSCHDMVSAPGFPSHPCYSLLHLACQDLLVLRSIVAPTAPFWRHSAYIINDIAKANQKYLLGHSTYHLDSFVHEVSDKYSPHWEVRCFMIIYDSISSYTFTSRPINFRNRLIVYVGPVGRR
jgi:hypothetical protein